MVPGDQRRVRSGERRFGGAGRTSKSGEFAACSGQIEMVFKTVARSC